MNARLVWESHARKVLDMFIKRFRVHVFDTRNVPRERFEMFLSDMPPILGQRRVRQWIKALPRGHNVVVWAEPPRVVSSGTGLRKRYMIRFRAYTYFMPLRDKASLGIVG